MSLKLPEFLDNLYMNVVRLSALSTGRFFPTQRDIPGQSTVVYLTRDPGSCPPPRDKDFMGRQPSSTMKLEGWGSEV